MRGASFQVENLSGLLSFGQLRLDPVPQPAQRAGGIHVWRERAKRRPSHGGRLDQLAELAITLEYAGSARHAGFVLPQQEPCAALRI